MAKTTRTCVSCGVSHNIYLDNDAHRAMAAIDTKQGCVYICTDCTTDTPVNNRIVGTPKRHGFQYRITTDASIALLAHGFTINDGLCHSPLYNGLCAPSKLELNYCSVSIYNSKYDSGFWKVLADVLPTRCISTDCINISNDEIVLAAKCWTEILSKCYQLYTDISDADILTVNIEYSVACLRAKFKTKGLIRL